MAAVLICATGRQSARAVSARQHGHIVSTTTPSGLEAALDRHGPQILVVAAAPSVLTSALLEQCDSRGIRTVALISSDDDRRNVAALGLLETVDAAASWPEIEAVLTAPAIAGAAPTAAEARRGHVIAVWGPAGAPGRTSLAIAFAAELAAAGHSVALGDADTHAASVAPSLGLLDEAPGFAAACRLAGSQSLTRSELERVAQRYASGHGGMWVLTGIGRPSRWPELSADRVVATIRECRAWVDYTVLDVAASIENDEEISSDLFAPRRNAAAIACLREADTVVAVGSADPVGLSRFLRAHVELLDLVTEARVVPVANKVRTAAIGLDAGRQVKQSLSRFGGIGDAVLIPHDQPAFDAALLSGRTLPEVAPRSPARVAVQRLVAERILERAAPGRQRVAATA